MQVSGNKTRCTDIVITYTRMLRLGHLQVQYSLFPLYRAPIHRFPRFTGFRRACACPPCEIGIDTPFSPIPLPCLA